MYIIINATALDSSGALSILKQFIDAIPEDEYIYILFISEKINLKISQQNIRLISINTKSLVKRFMWDTFRLRKWLGMNKIIPLATISLQNTNVKINESIPNFIYFHQAIPFFKVKWNPFSKSEKTLWFYKNIYPFFVKLHINNKTEIFVQMSFIKDGFSTFFNFPKERIHIIRPKLSLPQQMVQFSSGLDDHRLNLFYPATNFVYKNHTVILKALSLLDEQSQKNITLHLTIEHKESGNFGNWDDSYFEINYLGKVPYDRVIQLYKEVDAVLFPSYIETFGLPLIEAASFGVPIVVADLPYAREVLGEYSGACYVCYNDEKLWQKEIFNLFSKKGLRYPPIKIGDSNSWQELFEIVKKKINKDV